MYIMWLLCSERGPNTPLSQEFVQSNSPAYGEAAYSVYHREVEHLVSILSYLDFASSKLLLSTSLSLYPFLTSSKYVCNLIIVIRDIKWHLGPLFKPTFWSYFGRTETSTIRHDTFLICFSLCSLVLVI